MYSYTDHDGDQVTILASANSGEPAIIITIQEAAPPHESVGVRIPITELGKTIAALRNAAMQATANLIEQAMNQ